MGCDLVTAKILPFGRPMPPDTDRWHARVYLISLVTLEFGDKLASGEFDSDDDRKAPTEAYISALVVYAINEMANGTIDELTSKIKPMEDWEERIDCIRQYAAAQWMAAAEADGEEP